MNHVTRPAEDGGVFDRRRPRRFRVRHGAFLTTCLLSNVVSNVPAVMLLLPLATRPLSGVLLALASTLAGNLLIVGSIANIIVVDAAARQGVRIDWRQHARVGVPVTLATLAVAAGYLWLRLG
jgi:Na+/H+ antiporter NhaD/arsenite permease-like protein